MFEEGRMCTKKNIGSVCDNCSDKVRCALENTSILDPIIEKIINFQRCGLVSHAVITRGSKQLTAYDSAGKLILNHLFDKEIKCAKIISLAKTYGGDD